MSKNFASREVLNLNIVDYKTQVPVLHCDYANTTSSEMTSDSVYAYGGWNRPKRVTFNGNRDVTFTVNTQMRSFELYRLITGGNIETTAKFLKREELTAAAGVLTLSKTPIAGTVNVFKDGDDCGTLETVTISDKTATLSDTSDNGKDF